MYEQETMDYVHDTLIDLIISCMKSSHIPIEEPEIGDWCIELSSKNDRDNSVGKLLKKYDEKYGKDNVDTVYEIELIGGKVVTWRNAFFSKIPNEYLRNQEGN